MYERYTMEISNPLDDYFSIRLFDVNGELVWRHYHGTHPHSYIYVYHDVFPFLDGFIAHMKHTEIPYMFDFITDNDDSKALRDRLMDIIK